MATLPTPATFLAIARELFETLFWPGAIVLLGAVLMKPRLWGRPRARLLVLIWMATWFGVMTALLIMPSKGYLDGRHTLPLQVLLFALLGLALSAWEKPMQWWMNVWRRQREKWESLPPWMRWPRWPEVFAMGAASVMLLPGLYELSVPPRADKAHLIAAAHWIQTHAAPGVVVADYERLVGFYSQHPYAKWWAAPTGAGPGENLELEQLAAIRRQTHAPVLVGMEYDPLGPVGLGVGRTPQLTLGPYHAVAAFESPVLRVIAGRPQRYTYVLYALPEDPVLTRGVADFLSRLPALP